MKQLVFDKEQMLPLNPINFGPSKLSLKRCLLTRDGFPQVINNSHSRRTGGGGAADDM